jgi:methionyl-tRNA formyltransferase
VRLKVLEAGPAASGDAPRLEPGEVRGDRRRVLVGTADGALELRRVQPAGRTAMPAADWWRGLGVERAVAR